MRAVTVGLAVLLAGCTPNIPVPPPRPAGVVPADANQVIVVKPTGISPFQVEAVMWERRGNGWAIISPPLQAVIGPKGFAKADAKREGDGCTPTGVYRIGTAFGYDKPFRTGLSFRPATENDFWVDDPASPDYNRWVTGKPNAKSFEKLKRDDDHYSRAAVIEYNTDPVVPGKGSAIFLHVWGGAQKPTEGCVALSKYDVETILQWLDQKARPVIVLNP